MGTANRQKSVAKALRIAHWVTCALIGLNLTACEDSPVDRCVKSRLKVWDAHSEKTPWRISEATGQTRSDFEAKARGWCAQEASGQ
jgi:hypothetical protein